MKKIFTVILLIVISLSGYAQKRGGGAPNWISIALKGGYGNSIFLCKQAKDVADGKFSYKTLAPSYCFGGRLGVVFVDKVGMSVEYLASTYNPKNSYSYSYNNGNFTLDNSFKMKASDLLLLARYTGEYGFYCELGPKFTTAKEVTREFDASASMVKVTTTDDVSDNFKKKFSSLVFGFGFSPYNGDRVIVSLGLRASYCTKDIYDGINENQAYGFNMPIQNVEMKPFSVQFVLDINYHFARFGTATCGKQKIIFFK
jgi:hypothetical protein